MSRSSTASTSKIPPQLPTKSAWARGPPQTSATASSSRSQSPAPSTPNTPNGPSNFHPTHSRRPSTLGQGVSIKDGVSVPRSTVGAVKPGSAVTFGSIDDAAAPISSSLASAPPVKSEGVKSFGSVAVQNGVSSSAKSALLNRPPSLSQASTSQSNSAPPSTPSPHPKIDIAKLFQGPSVTSTLPPVDSSSPAVRTTSLPPQSHPPSQPYTPPNFTPGGNLRPQGQNGNSSGGAPRSPVFSRPMTNGTSGGVGVSGRPQTSNGPGSGPVPAAMPSPRLAPHPPAGMPQANMWPQYYYPQPYMTGMPPDQQYMAYSPQWMQPQLPPHNQPPPQHHPQGLPGPPSSGLPMSPRNPPPPLQQVPSTPTQTHALPPPLHAPHGPSNVTSPPPTPSTANGPNRLNTNASAFVPQIKKSAISIKNVNGQEVDLGALKGRAGHQPPTVVPPPAPASPSGFKKDSRRTSVRIESQEQKEKRLAEEQRKEREKAESERKVKEEKERKEKERKDAEEKVVKEKEAEERRERERKEAEERSKREAEQRKKEAEAEEERKRREEEDKKVKEQQEKARVEEEERARRAEEQRQEEEAKAAATEAEDKAKSDADAAASAVKLVPPTTPETIKEDGEIEEQEHEAIETAKEPEAIPPVTEAPSSKPSEKESLRIDTALSPDQPRRRPGPLNLSTTINANISAPLPSALATARIIEDINHVSYPEGIRSPKVELNVNAAAGKFRYDREFLLQFMKICQEKPDNLPPLDAIGIEPSDQSSYNITRGGSGRRQASNSITTPTSRTASIGLGFIPGSMGKSSGANPFAMGQFATTASKLSSEERFMMASTGGRSTSVSSGLGGPIGGRPSPMVRTTSQGGPGSGKERDRTRSKRGEKRPISTVGHPSQAMGNQNINLNMGPPLEPVAPLEVSVNRWVAGSTRRVVQPDTDSPEVVDRKVKGLLNKLTMERFDSISDQIIAWANKSEKEKDGRTLIQVIRLVFEKATDEATFSEMYARLCRKMMEMISPKVQDDGIINQEGKPFAGGHLFRKYLLNRCQEDFERGWVAKEATAAAAASKATEDEATKAAQKGKEDEEAELYSDEYYAAAKAKRRGLGLIRFIGELFKLQMLTERIMHECIKKLLGNVENPEEEEIESLCKLLSTVGVLLDTPKAHAHMDVYFSRMKELTKSKNVNSRMQYMLQDVIELRERKWIPRKQVAAPATIAQIHEAAAKEKAVQEKESYNRQISMSRGGSRRGGDRGEGQHGPDGWSVAGSGPPRPPPKAGDLSNFGKISKPAAMTFGPSSVFAGKKEPKGRENSISRTASSSNMFSMLSQTPEVAVEATNAKSSRPPSRKPSVDLGQAGIPEAPLQRRKLQLLPRSKPVEEASAAGETPAGSEVGSEDEAGDAPALPTISAADANKKIAEDVKEFFGIRSLDEAESYFSSLPAEHRHRLVDKLLSESVEKKDADVRLVADLFVRVREKGGCSPEAFEEGFNGLAEILEDVAVDVPKAWTFFVTLLKGSGLDKDDERRARLAEKTMNADKLLSLLT